MIYDENGELKEILTDYKETKKIIDYIRNKNVSENFSENSNKNI